MKLAHHLCHIQHKMLESDYQLLFDYLKVHLKKRTLVLFLTDIIDDAYFELFKKKI